MPLIPRPEPTPDELERLAELDRQLSQATTERNAAWQSQRWSPDREKELASLITELQWQQMELRQRLFGSIGRPAR